MSENTETVEVGENELTEAQLKREAATKGYWRWLVISKKDIESDDKAEVVFKEYSPRNRRWIAIVDFTGGAQALSDHFSFGPAVPGDGKSGLVYDDPTNDAEERLCLNEADILVKLRNSQR